MRKKIRNLHKTVVINSTKIWNSKVLLLQTIIAVPNLYCLDFFFSFHFMAGWNVKYSDEDAEVLAKLQNLNCASNSRLRSPEGHMLPTTPTEALTLHFSQAYFDLIGTIRNHRNNLIGFDVNLCFLDHFH